MGRRRAREMDEGKRARSTGGVRRRTADGTYLYKVRIDTTDATGRQLVRGGFTSENRARAARNRVTDLLHEDVAGTNDWFRRKLGDLIFERTRHGRVLPTRDEIRAWRRANHAPTASMPTL